MYVVDQFSLPTPFLTLNTRLFTTMNTIEKHLVALQQQLEHLNAEVTTLLALTSASHYIPDESTESTAVNPSTKRTVTHSQKSQVGINRYRQLANEQAGHPNDPAERYAIRRDI